MTEDVTEVAETGAPDENVLVDAPTVEEPVPADKPVDPAPTDDDPAWYKRRFDKITAQKHDALRQAEEARAEVKRLQEQLSQVPQAELPNLDAFDNTADYNKALAEYVKAEAQKAAAMEAAEFKSRQAKATAAQSLQDFQKREAKFAAQTPDYMSVTRNESLPITQTMLSELQDSEKAPEVLYHLGKNPGEAFRISQLQPVEQARALASIELQLSRPTKPSTTNAPPPPAPTQGGSAAASLDPSKMTPRDYLKWRMEGGGRS